MHFADRLIQRCHERNSRLVVGLDPHWDRIPASFKRGFAPDDYCGVISGFLTHVIDVTHEHAVAFKPQIAFFEQFGLAGMEALDKVLAHLRVRHCLVLMDGKRNDIGSTAAAYARAFFGQGDQPAGFPSDALTVNAYLGSDGIKPFLQSPNHGIFVLVKTSNPSSGEFQDMKFGSGASLSQTMAAAVRQWNEPTIGESGYGNVGAVIGATYPEHMAALRREMPCSLILVPGYGAQGGSAQAVKAAFNEDGLGALINSSRGILFPAEFEKTGFEAIREAACDAREDINRIVALRDL